ncbi:MAG: ChrR family anti-sigma-E factor [Pseudomonadota bacterium]
MTVSHVLNEKLMLAYAAGTLPEAFNLVIATHLSLCDESRAMVAAGEAIGGCVLDRCAPIEMGSAALTDTLARIKRGRPEARAKAAEPGLLPEPLRTYVGGDVSHVKWKALGGGVKQAILPVEGDATARLLFIPGGQAVPDHGHNGMELTLVLQGAYADEVDRFARGDLEIADEELEHQPVAEDGEDCICLSATDAPLKFNAVMPRLMQRYFRI